MGDRQSLLPLAGSFSGKTFEGFSPPSRAFESRTGVCCGKKRGRTLRSHERRFVDHSMGGLRSAKRNSRPVRWLKYFHDAGKKTT